LVIDNLEGTKNRSVYMPERPSRHCSGPAMSLSKPQRLIMTKWNRKQPTWAGRTIIPDQFIIWIDPGVVGEMRTVASALRAGEIGFFAI
jgi:hypothetical protein